MRRITIMKSGLTGIMISIVVYLAAMVYVGWYFSKKIPQTNSIWAEESWAPL